MHKILLVMTAVLMIFSAPKAEEQPVQPPAEVDIATRFQAAAPALFDAWVDLRPEVLKAVGLGEMQDCGGPGAGHYMLFITCSDLRKPTLDGIDVLKTDSILSPYRGLLRVSTVERCVSHRVVPGRTWSMKKWAPLLASCEGQPYEKCIAAGAKPAPGLVGSACTGGPQSTFTFKGDFTLSYLWSKGKWEFERQEGDRERPPADQRTALPSPAVPQSSGR